MIMKNILLTTFLLFSIQVFSQADIVGGEDCDISEYPWQAAIYADGYLCGASVIHQYWVITAAHCVEIGNQVVDAESITVGVGSSNEYAGLFGSGGDEYEVEEVISHASYGGNGDDIALLATGTMVSNSIDAARELNNKNISVSVYNFHTIKPLDTESLKNIFSKYKLVISIEEHNVIGGLGSAISEEISSYNKLKAPLLKLGIPDTYNHTGEYREVLDKVGLNSKGIFQNILKRLEKL